MEQKALKLIMAGLLILSMALTGREAAEYVGAMHAVNALRETGMGADDSGRADTQPHVFYAAHKGIL